MFLNRITVVSAAKQSIAIASGAISVPAKRIKIAESEMETKA
jgi:hypothetical protein